MSSQRVKAIVIPIG